MLADFHIHSTYSDGLLTIPQLVDLYGQQGFGAIAITDHLCEEKTFLGKAAKYLNKTLRRDNFQQYLEEIEAEKERAWRLYKMNVVAGVEITKNSLMNHRSAHVVILGVTNFISADTKIDLIPELAREQGALTIAAHPVFTREIEKQTYHLWDRRQELRNIIDLWEVASGKHMFPEVLQEKLPMIANSDLHRPEQLTSWKTVLDCEKSQEAIFDSLKKQKIDF
jgi:predicted metal-dependent phosphoesterase TrpH